MRQDCKEKRKQCIKRTVIFIVSLLLLLSPLAAQNDEKLTPLHQFEQETRKQISDEDLKLFGEAVIAVQQIQAAANQEIDSIISNSSLSEERIQEILSIQQNKPDTAAESVSKEEMNQYRKAIETISEVHQQAQSTMTEAVHENGLTVEEFNQMAQEIQQNPDLSDRLEALFAN